MIGLGKYRRQLVCYVSIKILDRSIISNIMYVLETGIRKSIYKRKKRVSKAEIDKVNNKLSLLGIGYKVTSELGVEVLDKNIKKVIIPDIVNTIHKDTFRELDNLESVIIGKNVKVIDDRAFLRCRELKNVVLGKNVRYIGKHAFCMCESLESIHIGDKVKIIDNEAFSSCNLHKVNIGKGIRLMGYEAFGFGCKHMRINIRARKLKVYWNTFRGIEELTMTRKNDIMI